MASPINFRSDADLAVDTYVGNSSFYGNLPNQGEGIDLRVEMRRILYGYGSRKPKGHWIAYRRYTTTLSTSYNRDTKEGVGGPAYTYSDEAIRVRQVPMGKNRDKLEPLKAGIDIEDVYIYYFEYTEHPKIDDDIFEISLDNHLIRLTDQTITNYNYLDKYKIKRVHPYRLEGGNIQYWMCVAQRDEITY